MLFRSSIESGKYITSLEANWVATGTGEYTDLSHAGFNVIKLSEPLANLRDKEARAAWVRMMSAPMNAGLAAAAAGGAAIPVVALE